MPQRYLGQSNFHHGRPPQIGIVLVNLGTPEAPEPGALRRYLGEFLSDPRVVEIPKPLWKLILHGIVLRVRPKKSARTYASIWTDEGSPLMVHSRALMDKVAKEIDRRSPDSMLIRLAMRYGKPSIDTALTELQQAGAEQLMVVPLYPQYSGATTGSVADAMFASLGRWRWVPELQLLGAYHDHPAYIRAVADSIQAHWRAKGRGDKLMISFHGMPKATLDAGDPYFCHCHKTARLLAESLQLLPSQWEMAFQSRFGRAKWLQPYLAGRLEELPDEGVKRLDVVCPGFAVDCVETLEEIAIEGRELFSAAGGEHFEYIPALNDQDVHVELHARRILKKIEPWLDERNLKQTAETADALQQSRSLALAAGAKQ